MLVVYLQVTSKLQKPISNLTGPYLNGTFLGYLNSKYKLTNNNLFIHKGLVFGTFVGIFKNVKFKYEGRGGYVVNL